MQNVHPRQWLWASANGLARGLEGAYRRANRLQSVGDLILLRLTEHREAEHRLEDGTVISPGDEMAVIHFNNSALRAAQTQRSRRHGGFVFARLLMDALRQLADAVEADARLRTLVGFRGVTWIPPHGRRLGFEIAPLPTTWRTRLLAWHFRLVLYGFNPETSRRVRGPLTPHEFWMSRQQLLANFGSGRRPR